MQAQINKVRKEYYGTQFLCTVTNDKGIARDVYVSQDLNGVMTSVVWGYGDRPLEGFNNFREAAYEAVREHLAA